MLDYMDSICANLTQEVDDLVAHGAAIDQLLELSTFIQENRHELDQNLTSLMNSLSSTALRANEYHQFNSSGVDTQSQLALTYILLALGICVLVGLPIYLCFYGCKIKRYALNQLEQCNNMGDNMCNISVTESSSMDSSDREQRHRAKVNKMERTGFMPNSTPTHISNLLLLAVILVIGFSSIAYTKAIGDSRNRCQ